MSDRVGEANTALRILAFFTIDLMVSLIDTDFNRYTIELAADREPGVTDPGSVIGW